MLRLFTASFRHQGWTAVAIEFIVVIAGVFIGVQASNWNAQRETDQKAAVFAARLEGDLREEACGYANDVEYEREVLASAQGAADAPTGKTQLPDEGQRRPCRSNPDAATGSVTELRAWSSAQAFALDSRTRPARFRV